MSARDPLSTVLHYDVYVRVILAYLAGLRMCLHCPRCSKEKITLNRGETMYQKCKVVPCQNKFGNNARVMGGTFGMAESLAAATENQGNDTPHIHGIMALATPYQYKTLLEIRDLIKQDVSNYDRIKRFISQMCREDHFDDEGHQNSLENLEKAKAAGLSGLPHFRIASKPSFLRARSMSANQPSLWDLPLESVEKHISVLPDCKSSDAIGSVPASSGGSATKNRSKFDFGDLSGGP